MECDRHEHRKDTRSKREHRKSDLGPLFNKEKEDEAKAEVANLRLQAIASLPKLAIFSDEAHHTYGQAMDADLKKVRMTVDYLHNPYSESEKREAHETQLVCVVNTTGTPYFQRQPLRDVVAWSRWQMSLSGRMTLLKGNTPWKRKRARPSRSR